MSDISRSRQARKDETLILRLITNLSLNELEAASCLFAAVLLGFLDARIAGKEATGSKFLAKAIVVLKQRSRDAELDRAGLTGDAAAGASRLDVKPGVHREVDEWASDEDLKHWSAEILFEVSTVDANVSLAGSQPHTGDRTLSATRSVVSRC
jgi:hypothetical protein